MIQEQHPAPLGWLQAVIPALQWPGIVLAAFWLGRYVRALEMRAVKAEENVKALLERHLPAVHRALAEIRGLLLTRR
jgi:hypothetical protein